MCRRRITVPKYPLLNSRMSVEPLKGWLNDVTWIFWLKDHVIKNVRHSVLTQSFHCQIWSEYIHLKEDMMVLQNQSCISKFMLTIPGEESVFRFKWLHVFGVFPWKDCNGAETLDWLNGGFSVIGESPSLNLHDELVLLMQQFPALVLTGFMIGGQDGSTSQMH